MLESSCALCTLRLLATSLWLALRASLRLFKIVPDDFVSARRLLALMYKDVLYAGFAGAKTDHEKITIIRDALYKIEN